MNLNLNISINRGFNLITETRPHQLPRYYLSLTNVPIGAHVAWEVARVDGRVLFSVGGRAGSQLREHPFAHGRADAPVFHGWCGTCIITAVSDGVTTSMTFYNLGVGDLTGQLKGLARKVDFGELHPVIISQDTDEAYRTAVSTPNSYITVHPALSKAYIALNSDVVANVERGIFDGRGATLFVTNHATKIEGARAHVMAYVEFCDNDVTPETDGLTYRNFEKDAHVVALHCGFERCADGGLDVIWNNGHRVRVTIQACRFAEIDKACLIDSGSAEREGGRYAAFVVDTLFDRCKQRQVMIRNGTATVVNTVIEAFGDAQGNGTALNPADGASLYAEGCVIVPGKVGMPSWDGSPFVKPRQSALSSKKAYVTAVDNIGCGDMGRNDAVCMLGDVDIQPASMALYRRVWRTAGHACSR